MLNNQFVEVHSGNLEIVYTDTFRIARKTQLRGSVDRTGFEPVASAMP
jgi:hypothetical protein